MKPVLMFGLFLAILSQTLLNVAIPYLINKFGVRGTAFFGGHAVLYLSMDRSKFRI